MTGVWVTNDTISATRMNEKTIFQGSGSDISGLTTYAGMVVFCTSSGSGFIADVLYRRNAANTSWSPVSVDQLPYLTLSTTIGDYSQPAAAVASSSDTITPDVDLDFTEYADQSAFDAAWITSSTATLQGNPSNDNIEIKTTATLASMYYDLGASVSNSAWVIRFKLTFSTAGATNLGLFWLVLSDNTTGTAQTAQSHIGIEIYDNDNNVYAQTGNAIRPDGAVTQQVFSAAISPSATTYYVQMIRLTSTSFKAEFFSDSAFTTSLGSATVATDALTGLRYFKLLTYTSGAMIGTLDDFKFWNGITSVAYSASNAVDNSTSTRWQSTSEANPNIYVDLSSAREIVGVALNIDKTNTTVTSLKIRASTDTSFADGENVAYISISDFTDDTWRFLANNFLAANCRYVQIYANETGVLAVNEVKVRYGVSDLIKILTHKHRTRNTSASDSHVDSN